MTFNRGTLEEFTTWHEQVKLSEEIPPEGKIGFVNGIPAPLNQRTMSYSKTIAHPVNNNDYIWYYGDYPSGEELTLEQVQTLGWFPPELL